METKLLKRGDGIKAAFFDGNQLRHRGMSELGSDIPETIFADGWLIEPATDFADIMAFYREQQAAYPQHRLLLLLNDCRQAEYTSMHCCLEHDLDSVEEEGVVDASESAWFIRRQNFERLLDKHYPERNMQALRMQEVFSELKWKSEDWQIFAELIRQPERVLDENWLFLVPVEQNWQLIMAFPNGYFSGSLSPFDIAVLAEHLETEFGCKLFGIGANVLGFIKENSSIQQVQGLCRWLMETYQFDDVEEYERFQSELQALLSSYPYFFITYDGDGNFGYFY